MESSSSPVSSTRAPPLSLPEFVDLVSAALDSPAPDPDLSFTSLQQQAMSMPSPVGRRRSGVRQVLSKIKNLVARYSISSTRPAVGRRTTSPEYRIPSLHLSSGDAFSPYLTLAVQAERASTRPYPSQHHNAKVYSISTPALLNQSHALHRANSGSSDHENSLSSCAPSASLSSSSAGSCSSSTATTDSFYPTTPLTTVSEEGCGSRWSAYSSAEPEHPKPTSDPNSTEKPSPRLPSFHSVPNFHALGPIIVEKTRRQRRRLPAPITPPPTCPLPPTPYISIKRHPYASPQPLPPPSPMPRNNTKSRSDPCCQSAALLNAFPTPPAHPVPLPQRNATRLYRASSPFPLLSPRTPPRPIPVTGNDWLDLESSPSAASHSSIGSEAYHSACEEL